MTAPTAPSAVSGNRAILLSEAHSLFDSYKNLLDEAHLKHPGYLELVDFDAKSDVEIEHINQAVNFDSEQLEEALEAVKESQYMADKANRLASNLKAAARGLKTIPEDLNTLKPQQLEPGLQAISDYELWYVEFENFWSHEPAGAINPTTLKNDFIEATCRPEFILSLKKHLVRKTLGFEGETSQLEETFEQMATALVKFEVLVLPSQPVWIKDTYRCFEVRSSGVYRIPAALLKAELWRDPLECIPVGDFDDTQVDTVAVLFGGSAYPELKDAAKAASAL